MTIEPKKRLTRCHCLKCDWRGTAMVRELECFGEWVCPECKFHWGVDDTKEVA